MQTMYSRKKGFDDAMQAMYSRKQGFDGDINPNWVASQAGLLSSAEVEAHIDIDIAEDVVGRERFFVVVIGVEDGTDTGKPARSVVDKSHAGDAVDGELVEVEVVELAVWGLRCFADGVQIGERSGQRYIQQKVFCKDPVVGIASRDGEVIIFHMRF